MRILLLAAAATFGGAAFAPDGYAQDGDCIENAAGQIVCGVDADAVRARIRAEERLQTPGLDAAAGARRVPARLPSTQAQAVSIEPAEADDFYTDDQSAPIQPVAAAAGPIYVSSGAQANVPPAPARRGSVYSSYDRSIFLRPGYVFAARGAGSFGAPSVATGYRSVFHRAGASAFAFEGELHFLRDEEDFLLLGVPTETTLFGLTGLGGVRWSYALAEYMSPFASVAIGPSYFRGKVESGGVTLADGDFTLAYSGRAGVEFNISDQFSLETAYRYLGTTQSGTPGFHSAELGLNYNF